MQLHVLLVEDDPIDLQQHLRDLPSVFENCGVDVALHGCSTFDDAFERTETLLQRYDMIISDTYRGPTDEGDAAVLGMVERYRGKRFCPLVIYSSGVRPTDLPKSPFILWADKGTRGDIERAIETLLDSGIPQLARRLHTDLESATGPYLWSFLEASWDRLNNPEKLERSVLEQMVRRRAAVQISDIDSESNTFRLEKHAPEYYVYPAFDTTHYNLGDILKARSDSGELRVVLTPHCHLFIQTNQTAPRADHVLVAKALPVASVLGDKLKLKGSDPTRIRKKLAQWAQSPAKTEVAPTGRHWYLPGFLDIPHSFCDLMQIESVAYANLAKDYKRIATLTPPYAEALQSCFAAFYAQVGIPSIRPESIQDMLT